MKTTHKAGRWPRPTKMANPGCSGKVAIFDGRQVTLATDARGVVCTEVQGVMEGERE